MPNNPGHPAGDHDGVYIRMCSKAGLHCQRALDCRLKLSIDHVYYCCNFIREHCKSTLSTRNTVCSAEVHLRHRLQRVCLCLSWGPGSGFVRALVCICSCQRSASKQLVRAAAQNIKNNCDSLQDRDTNNASVLPVNLCLPVRGLGGFSTARWLSSAVPASQTRPAAAQEGLCMRKAQSKGSRGVWQHACLHALV